MAVVPGQEERWRVEAWSRGSSCRAFLGTGCRCSALLLVGVPGFQKKWVGEQFSGSLLLGTVFIVG